MSRAILSGCTQAGASEVATVIACERAEDLKEAVEEIAEEVEDNDLEDAREEITDLRRDFDSLSSRVERLGDAERGAIEPLLAGAASAITALELASDVAGLQAALAAGGADIEALAPTVDTTLD